MIYTSPSSPPDFGRLQRPALIIGIVGLIGCIVAALVAPAQFFPSYLVGYLFWTGIALGCLVISMVHYLAGGEWGAVIRRLVEAGARTLPVMAVLFIPLLFGLQILYIWARPGGIPSDPALHDRYTYYLNVPLFLVRAVAYFAIWLILLYLLSRWSREQDLTADPRFTERMRRLSGPGLALIGLSVTFALVDWVMSLEPDWYSTIYGAMVGMGLVLAAFALITAMVALLSDRPPLVDVLTPTLLNDFGSLLLAFVMIWAYLSFSQFMLIWIGNLTTEIPWYLRRVRGGWQVIAIAIILFHFALPFILLIIRDIKRSARPLAAVAILVFVSQFASLVWLVEPAFYQGNLQIAWLSIGLAIVAVVGVGGIWVAMFARGLTGVSLIAPHDPQRPLPGEEEQQHA